MQRIIDRSPFAGRDSLVERRDFIDEEQDIGLACEGRRLVATAPLPTAIAATTAVHPRLTLRLILRIE
jgi:hypothetical protein